MAPGMSSLPQRAQRETPRAPLPLMSVDLTAPRAPERLQTGGEAGVADAGAALGGAGGDGRGRCGHGKKAGQVPRVPCGAGGR